MQNILVVVDMQKDFIDGALGTPEAAAILPAVRKKIRDFDGTIFFTRDTHTEAYLSTQEGRNLPVPHCILGTAGWQIDPSLDVSRAAAIFDKPGFGSLALTAELIRQNAAEPVGCVTLIGVCTDICVISNAMLIKAALPEARVVIDADCCAGVTPENHRTALAAVRPCQIEVIGNV